MTHICVSEQGHHWFRYWPVAWLAPRDHLCQWWAINLYLNQCWNIVNWTRIFIQENQFQNVVKNSRPFCLGLNVLIPNSGEYRINMVQHNAMFAQRDNSKDTTNFRIWVKNKPIFSLHGHVIEWIHYRVNVSWVTGEFPSQRAGTRSIGVFFDLCLNKRASKQSRRR